MDNRICAQLYNIRSYCKTVEGLDESLAKLQKIGYKTIQVSGIGADISAESVKSLADKYGMEIMLTHTPEAKYINNLSQVIKDHHTMNCKIAGLGSMGSDNRNMEGVKEFVERYNKSTMLGRMANGTDIKGLIVYLASDASAYMTGAVIPLDGGYSAK